MSPARPAPWSFVLLLFAGCAIERDEQSIWRVPPMRLGTTSVSPAMGVQDVLAVRMPHGSQYSSGFHGVGRCVPCPDGPYLLEHYLGARADGSGWFVYAARPAWEVRWQGAGTASRLLECGRLVCIGNLGGSLGRGVVARIIWENEAGFVCILLNSEAGTMIEPGQCLWPAQSVETYATERLAFAAEAATGEAEMLGVIRECDGKYVIVDRPMAGQAERSVSMLVRGADGRANQGVVRLAAGAGEADLANVVVRALRNSGVVTGNDVAWDVHGRRGETLVDGEVRVAGGPMALQATGARIGSSIMGLFADSEVGRVEVEIRVAQR